MAAYTSLLLVIALCAATAHSLKCYTCTEQPTNDQCLTETDCKSDETYCQTMVATAPARGKSAIIKMCTSSCTPYSGSNNLGSGLVSCCTTDLCNYSGGGSGGASGGASIRSSCAAIILALGSVLIIVKSSVL
ncbi:secreted Ly-6/uPAR-related protein 1-like [Eleutherodactylus coqui]|uniref:secreted Ly-6/uPAR-related protein 1-like n=1 Tax=Eleutherodactylus coqui TaxID=57060 RepID=UPI0034620233